ncbi:MAG: hypothetical protein LUH21_04205 [Clostridiales bacterium]|nr:hypothetical protein [Clostridiales bacterium]
MKAVKARRKMSKIYIEVAEGLVSNVYTDSQEPLEVILCDHDNARNEKEFPEFGNESTVNCEKLSAIKDTIKCIY